jgi:transketolase
MRNTFLKTLIECAEADPRICLVVGDLGYSVVEPFRDRFGPRFLNAGVAEQNMTGVAAGMAMAGHKVFTYSIANFPTLRCLEQIRNDICYHGADVTVVAVGGGLAYGALGYSHHAVQDISSMRSLPGMTLLLPGSPAEVIAVTRWKIANPGPAYLRIGKGGDPEVGSTEVTLTSPGVRQVFSGGPVAILAVSTALGWSASMARQNNAALYSLPIWKDTPDARVGMVNMVEACERCLVIEEHLPAGGIGSLLREVLEDRPDLQHKVRCLALDPAACGTVGSPAYLRKIGRLSDVDIVQALRG